MPPTPSAPHPHPAPAENLIEIGHRRFRVVRWTTAEDRDPAVPPLLFFSGIGGNAELLAPVFGALGREVVTFDMPGIGGSPAEGGPYRPGTIAKAACEILDRFGYGTVDVMGFSWGGIIAQQFAAHHADRTRRLILAGTTPGATMVPGSPLAISLILNPRKFLDPGYLHRYFDTIYGGGKQGWHEYYRGVTPPTGRGYLYQLLALWGWTGLVMLHRIKAPTMILAGDDDKLVPAANAHILQFLIPDAQIRWIEGAGHMFLLSDLDESVAAIQAFLA